MFEWKVEEMKLMHERSCTYIGKRKEFSFFHQVSRADKIAFVDAMEEGKLSILLDIIDRFNREKESMPTDKFGNIQESHMRRWILHNNSAGLFSSINFGDFYFLGVRRNLEYSGKGAYDAYEDLVDECFSRVLLQCESKEWDYFRKHDAFEIMKTKLKSYIETFGTTFGVNIAYSNNNIWVIDEANHRRQREITKSETRVLIEKYEALEQYIKNLSKEINIVY